MRFYTQPHRFYCGVDLHARTMYLCILDQAGQVVFDKNLPASFWGAEVALLRSVSTGPLSGRLTPLTCLAPLRADAPMPKFAGAADANASTAIRETRELKEAFFRIPECPY